VSSVARWREDNGRDVEVVSEGKFVTESLKRGFGIKCELQRRRSVEMEGVARRRRRAEGVFVRFETRQIR
jgi:hypothetical protein